MRILVVCSGLDFINYTRKATIEAIFNLNPELEVLMFNSVLNIRKKKIITPEIKFHFYHFWVLERFRSYIFPGFLERLIRAPKWKSFFKKFDLVFLIDPNQYYLLPYISKNQKLMYLLRDPSVLQDVKNYSRELPIINRANAILSISENLGEYYFQKYYGFTPANVHLWPNTVDLKLWDYSRWIEFKQKKARPVIGLSGNINYVIDIDLLIFLAENLPDLDFELAGKLELNDEEKQLFEKLLLHKNVKHLGFIPYNEFPSVVINWSLGIVAGKQEHEYAKYLNNNKQYQYLALGKPFVTYRFNADYSTFGEFVYIAENKFDFVEKIKLALSKSNYNIESAISLAAAQSSEIRANQFLSIAKSL
ncbi:MAG: hypothetical protein H6540_05355 [Bacteroidales bacterium]|nr:hypothetical protein [Bacteroidales bacterium]